MALPLTFLYPPATQPGGFSFDSRSVKIARHSNCSQCECRGWHPPEGCMVVIANGSAEAQAALDEAEELAGQVTDIMEEGFWRLCACGDVIEDHGNLVDVPPDEVERRARVAIRIDEILEDKGLLSDFLAAYSDPDVLSLRKQMVPFDEFNSRGSEVMSLPSSPGKFLNRFYKADLPPTKHRKAPDLNYSSDEDEVPLAATSRAPTGLPTYPIEPPRAFSSASASSGLDIEMEMELDNDPEPEPEPSGQRGGKSAATQPGMHKTVAAMGPAALPVDAPMVVEPVRVPDVAKVPVDERQIARLATGAAVDVSAFSEPIIPKPKPALIQEQRGTIRFTVVTNDGSPTSLILLTGLKTLFQKQLPKMPREYIARLVYDRSSQGMAIVKRGLRVVGGITFRPFSQRGFAEIVFFAISSVHQVAGFGAHLMNKFKMYIREQMPTIGHFLTYADNFAIGQGFTKEITLPRSVWMGYIKDYEGGTIMQVRTVTTSPMLQCSLIPKIDYLSVQELLAKQKQAILDKIRAKSRAHIVHPGLAHFKSGAGPVDYRNVPGLRESGWTPEMDEMYRPVVVASGCPNLVRRCRTRGVDETRLDLNSGCMLTLSFYRFPLSICANMTRCALAIDAGHRRGHFVVRGGHFARGVCLASSIRMPARGPHHSTMEAVLRELRANPASWPFLKPVNTDEVKDYLDVVKKPMDFAHMEFKIENDAYPTIDDFVADAQLVFSNCKLFNLETTVYHKNAVKMERMLQDILKSVGL
ncbi:histone acetyltransferase [Ceratobasidium sp. 414]|nr:histone acetyltransferase [Ceratobasidium sp. 414]